MKAKTYQGSPCRRAGHTERYEISGECVVCKNTYDKKERKAYDKKRYAENPEKKKAHNKKWRTENPEKKKAHNKKWIAENRGLKNHYNNLRDKRIKKQTPPWADLDKIKKIYMNCPKGYHIDHIHPISKGGLHIHYNLQPLLAFDNLSKGVKLLYNE